MSTPSTLVLFRRDLRLCDNPALAAAIQEGGSIIPVCVWSPEDEGAWPPGAASRWWLHHSLVSLQNDLRALGSELVLRRGSLLEALQTLIEETGATTLFYNRRYEPATRVQQEKIDATLPQKGVKVQSFNANLLFEPWNLANKQGKPYQVFSAFWRACQAEPGPGEPLPKPDRLKPPAKWPSSDRVEDWRLLPKIHWTAGMEEAWRPGEAGAGEQLVDFVTNALSSYLTGRDEPGHAGTSRLSPHLHFGEISPRLVWREILENLPDSPAGRESAAVFLKEIGWREFAHHLLYHFPHTPERSLKPRFENFTWREDDEALTAWQRGTTGYPLVDAGMRELWTTGWMHNRVRMIVGSFLVKDLLLPWQCGAAWFWDTLVDADLANNTLGWQWVAGCGADASPYFRIFNPTTQGEKFDPDGDYIRRWVPELAALPNKWIFRPSEAPSGILNAAGVTLGVNYPRPIVDHAFARDRALGALAKLST